MQRSLSDVWKQLFEHTDPNKMAYIPVVQYISAYKQGNCVQLKVQIIRNSVRCTRTLACGNFIAFVSAFNKLQEELATFIESNGAVVPPKNPNYEQRQITVIKKYLDKKRAEYAQIEAAKRLAHEIHISKTIGKVRPIIDYVLNRYRPVVDQFAYVNVYGRPVEKFFY